MLVTSLCKDNYRMIGITVYLKNKIETKLGNGSLFLNYKDIVSDMNKGKT